MSIKRQLPIFTVYLLGSLVALGQQTNSAPRTERNIAPRAEQILHAACQFLAETPYFAVTAEIWREHINEAGQKLQFTRSVDLLVKRPNRLQVEIRSAYTDRGFWYNGQELTVLDRKRDLFSVTTMPTTMDAMLDAAHDQFGIDLPLVDLALSDPYKNATARIQTGKYLGLSSALGYSCHHLAFTQDNIDWQVWIEDGPQPLIRKLVITHKEEPGSPEFTELIRSWDLVDRISDSAFVFQAPAGALKVQMIKESNGQPEHGQPQPAAGVSPTGRPKGG